MKSIASYVLVSAALTSALLFGAAPQGGDGKKPGVDTTQPWPWGTEAEADKIRAGLVGAWQLTSVRRSALTFSGEFCEGYLLVQPEHFSMQAHVSAPSDAMRDVYVEGFSAGTYRWSYDLGRLKLVVHTLLAASDFGGDVEYEPPGTQREYDLILSDDALTMSRGAEAEFNFVRIPPRPRAR